MSALALGNLLREKLAHLGGVIEIGELAVKEDARGQLLPTAIYARWSAKGEN
jgi:23S rRNA (cytosine1962-C5)-methyltransferase